MFGFFRKRRRERLRARPFPEAWDALLRKNLPFYSRLDDADRRELQGHIHVFLAEKHFEGCGGLELTDEIRVSIAAQACLLLLHRETDYYRRLITILVYPGAYEAPADGPAGGGLMLEGTEERLGEAWVDGVVVLSWDDVQSGAADMGDGFNVVLHEFAHQLDQEDGQSNGAPILEHSSHYVAWARVLGGEFEDLKRARRLGRSTVLDTYGANNPAEFFAVATECFFEKPARMKKKHPQLYDELKDYYRQDPLRLFDPAPRPQADPQAAPGSGTTEAPKD